AGRPDRAHRRRGDRGGRAGDRPRDARGGREPAPGARPRDGPAADGAAGAPAPPSRRRVAAAGRGTRRGQRRDGGGVAVTAGLDFNDRVLSDIRAAADIVEVIGDHTTLKKAGKSWKGLCPFHREKSPSFTVD